MTTPGSLLVASIVCLATFSSTLLGMLIAWSLPKEHFSAEGKDIIKLGLGPVATMSALVLGLLTAGAKGNFDTQRNTLLQIAASHYILDRSLDRYGHDADATRQLIKSRLTELADLRLGANQHKETENAHKIQTLREDMMDSVQQLTPGDDSQKAIKNQAIQILTDVSRLRWISSNTEEIGLPMPFFVVLTFWMSIVFLMFGLLAARNLTVIGVMFVCSLCVALAFFLIVDLDNPRSGFFQISDKTIRKLIDQIAH